MSDITTTWDTDTGDWSLAGTVLASGSDLQTAILISIFTDRRATADDVVTYGLDDPRGHWTDTDTRLIGSRLWLLMRAKETTETLNRARDYIAESLQWLIDDGVVGSFDITCQWVKPATLGAQVVAHRPDGTTESLRFAWAWN